MPSFMTYNIAMGEYTGSGLPAVALTIQAEGPDIVMLNEVRKYPFGVPGPYGVADQAEWLARKAWLDHW